MSSADSSPAQPTLHAYASLAQAELAAAQAVTAEMRRLIAAQGRAAVIFASSLSATFFDELVQAESVEWTRVIAFHTDERIGLAEDAPQSARKHLIEHLVSRVPIAEFHGLRGEAANPNAVCENYAAMLNSRTPDLAVLTVGRKGRLGFIDPHIPNEPAPVKIVSEPQRAVTLTTRALFNCSSFFVIAEEEQSIHPLLESQQDSFFRQAHFFIGR